MDDAIWQADRCSWVGATRERAPGGAIRPVYRGLKADLHGGTAGVGLFLAELAQATGDGACRLTALGALRHASSCVERGAARGSHGGLYTGRPGVALALALASRALADDELDDAARRASAEIGRPGPEDEVGLMAGSAGAIVGLLALRGLLNDGALLETAVDHGNALLGRACRAPTGLLSWPSTDGPTKGLTGLAHGASGVAVALLELASVTGRSQYRDAADRGFAYERSLYNAATRNWPDLRARRNQRAAAETFGTFWCQGAPGCALARLRAVELQADSKLRAEARVALDTTATWIASALESGSTNYSLCHGLAGNTEIVLEGRSLLPVAESLASQVAAAALDTRGAQDARGAVGAFGGGTPGLFLGSAGTGRFYLRLARPSLPSVLLVRPNLWLPATGVVD